MKYTYEEALKVYASNFIEYIIEEKDNLGNLFIQAFANTYNKDFETVKQDIINEYQKVMKP